jgi:hypothetical protein
MDFQFNFKRALVTRSGFLGRHLVEEWSIWSGYDQFDNYSRYHENRAHLKKFPNFHEGDWDVTFFKNWTGVPRC